MKIHMVDVVGQYQRIKPEIDAAVHKIIDSGQFILGKDVGELECQIAGFVGAKYAVGCASGTDALQIAMMALGIGPGDEVITTPFTFVATAETIALLGARPVYVDIDARTYNIDPTRIEAAVTSRTKAIIPVHLYGQAADMDPIIKIAHKHSLKVIEDSAQALGASYKGRKVCTFGDIAAISFFPSKNLGAFGDAGMVVCNDPALYERLRMIIVHGSKVKYHHEILGVNSRLDTLQAAILMVKLRHLENWNNARRRFAARYDEMLAGTPATVPYTSPACTHIFHQYTIRVPQRDALVDHLKEKGIPHAIYYPIPLHLQKAFAVSGSKRGDFPVAEQACDEVLSLPMHTELTEEHQAFITEAIKNFHAVH
jgi:UDP-2-acetamido-2-deoxy-ribo-hexuluronate aminotransferase